MTSVTGSLPETTTLITRLLHWKEEDAQKEAFVFYGGKCQRSALSRGELVDLASRFAYILKMAGIGYKDTVVNTLPNSLERVVTDMGITLAGASPVNSIPSLTSGEIFFSTTCRSHAKAVIVSPSSPENSDWILLKEGIVGTLQGTGQKDNDKTKRDAKLKDNRGSSSSGEQEVVFDYRSENAPEVKKLIVVSRASTWQRTELPSVPNFLKFLGEQSEKSSFIEKAVVSSDIAFMFTTTGTTGIQKIVPRTHQLIVKISETMGQMTPGMLPAMFYTTKLGWNSGFPYMFYLFGATCVMLDELDLFAIPDADSSPTASGKFATSTCSSAGKVISGGDTTKESREYGKDATDTSKQKILVNSPEIYDMCWKILKAEKILFAYLSPDEIDGLAASAKAAISQGHQPPEKLLKVATGGLPIKQSVVSSALERITREIIIGYGMTEAGVVSFNPVRSAENYIEGDCGRMFQGVQGRITDDSGKILPPGQIGNVEFKTQTIFQGFLNNVEKTREAFTPDGWFVTADMGFLTAEKTVTVVCRKDDVIMHGSVIVYPTAVERVLRKCPGVQDVVVVPVPNQVKHQNICACVITASGHALTEDSVKKSMDAMIALPRSAEIPTPQHVIFLDSFPLVQDFKVDRKKLEKIAKDYVSNPK